MMDDTQIIVCDEDDVKEKRVVKFSDLMDDFQIIRFENKEEALFKSRWMFFSDNYICVKQSDAAVKLFDKTGRFIANVGGFGQGPGEYETIIDCLIDEKGGSIYILPFVADAILKYDLQGNYLRDIKLARNINKGKLFLQSDSVFSLFNLCFKGQGSDRGFTGANIQLHNNDSIQYVYAEQLALNLTNEKGERLGYEHEVWSYRCAPDFPFTITHTDTLYHYISKENKVKACFTFKIDNKEEKGISFFVLNELPHHYLVSLAGKNGGGILVDKNEQEAYRVTFVNDFMGNMDKGMRLQDGYYWENREPLQLQEELEEVLSSGKCPEDQVERLTALKESLHENDNNILLLGKLKK